ncbi:hypothetical protein D046_3776B, partial [Vibrio parahaemolyticus V-223/04]
VFLIH